jgi:membrane protease YdiL (CAAX protease family)
LTAPLVFLVVLLPLSLISPNFVPSLLSNGDRGTLLLTGILPAVLVGICEELGWTGFATPGLRRGHGVLATGLIVGVLWGAWHVLALALWSAGITAGDMPMGVFVTLRVLDLLAGQLLAYRVLMVWVYDHTESVLLAALMHTGLLAATWVLAPTAATGVQMFVYGMGVGLGFWLVVAVLVMAGAFRTRQPAPATPARDAAQRRPQPFAVSIDV